MAHIDVPVMYSWPSEASVLQYTTDRENAEWSAPHLAGFIASFVRQSGIKTVHVLAHSMGNHCLTQAMLRWKEGVPEGVLSEVILAAPDVDASSLRGELAPIATKFSARLTLYVSTQDVALQSAKAVISSYARAGDASSGIVVRPPMETVDASSVRTDFMG